MTGLAADIRGTPVKAEHTGEALGTVVSGFVDGTGALNCVVRLDNSLQGEIARGLVRDGIAADFSLGYTVEVTHSEKRLLAGEQKAARDLAGAARGA